MVKFYKIHLFKILFFLLANLVSFTTFSQTASQQADPIMKLADEMFNFGSKRDALELYQKIVTLDQKNARAYFMLGKCYLEIFQKAPALENLQKAYKLNAKVDDEINLLMAKCLQAAYRFEEASQNYTIYKKRILADKEHKEQNENLLKAIEKRIQECNTAKDILKDTVKLTYNSSQDLLNTPSPDYAPVLSPDEKTIYFTSRREGSTGGKKDNDNEYFEDIYYSTKSGDKWSAPQNIGSPINTDFHEGCIGISKDGNELYIYREINGGDIYVSKLKSGKWDKPKALNQFINTEFYEPSMTLGDSGKSIIFSSNRPGGEGGLDLYVSHKDANGDWGEAINLGPEINSPLDEDGPFFDTKSKYLYFSSAGLKGMGGYDVYRSKKDSITHKWMKPANLGYPINTPDDDIFYTLSSDGKKALYSSYKKDGSGDRDIFEMDFPVDEFKRVDSAASARKKLKITDIKRLEHIQELERQKKLDEERKKKEEEEKKKNQHAHHDKLIPEHKDLTFEEKMDLKKLEDEQKKHDQEKLSKQNKQKKEFLQKDQFKKDSLVTIKGKILDTKTGKPLQAHIHVYDGKGKDFMKVQAGQDGSYSFKLPAKMMTEYSISFEIDGYMYKADKIKFDKVDKNNALQADVKLNKLEVGLKAVLRNVYFDINSAELRPDSYVELDKLVQLMKSNPNIKAKLGGHTDNLGPEKYNLALSKYRVNVVLEYLTSHGVEKSRIVAQGYGSSHPIASNDDEFEGRELNRRTEFEVVK